MVIQLSPINSRSKSKWYKHQKHEKSALNLQLQTIQILTYDVKMLILCLSYLIIAVSPTNFNSNNTKSYSSIIKDKAD